MEKKLGEILPVLKILAENQTKGVDSGVPFIVGAPGIGKTSILYQLCEKNNWGMLHLHMPLKPIEELSGIPLPREQKFGDKVVNATEWTLPDLLSPLHELSERYDIVIAFLDDMHLIGPDHLALCYELFTEKTLRGYKIPKNVAFVLAGNNSSKAGARTIYSAIINRLVHLPVTHDLDSWRLWALDKGVDLTITSFLTNDRYSRFAQEEEKMGEPWASLRSWTRFASIFPYINKSFADLLYYCSGYVGKSAATEFANFFKLFKKIDVKKILSGKGYKAPDNPMDAFVEARAVFVHVCKDKASIKKYTTPFSKYCGRFLPAHPEIGVSILKDLLLLEKEQKVKLFDKVLDYFIDNEPEVYEGLLKDLKLV